ncbi:uncharacterized protein LOC127858927 [Dreissena polymorpha]|uniref:G-protein coupled receptors family 1 profile domain-containing protein n=1 Tax=Dreissena polymorpha TaxID=45954 RepID=A0A9D3YZA8_DREPO|nr:uncharacterized protein LOC127858927 [Dreissena polymorpha]KAH3710123.1 hypothetical protein DPMN_069590 [Dreissena polymorpha]
MAGNVSSIDAIRKELNDEKATTLIPAMVVCGILMVLGTVGNVMVVYFYAWRTKTTTASILITCLSAFDLIACIFGIPIEISDMRLFYLFENVPACRLLVFVNHFAVIASAFTLCFIAMDRYKRICKPFERQLSERSARIICGVNALLGVAIGWPSIALYTVEEVPINTTYRGQPIQITGYDCTSVKAEAYQSYVWAYSVIQCVGFISVTLALVICYLLVGRQLYKHKQFRFYVAQNGLRRTASGNVTTVTMTTSTAENESSDLGITPLPITSIPEENEEDFEVVEYDGPDDDPPPMPESIPDLRELLELDAKGLPDVDNDRPPSALRGLFGNGGRPLSGRPLSQCSRPNSILTDASGRSKGSIMTVRSVVICDASENQVFSIEPRDKSTQPSRRPWSARSDSTWSNSITRPESACSTDTFARPDSGCSIRSIIDETTNKSDVRNKFLSKIVDSESSVNLKHTRSEGNVDHRRLRRSNSGKSDSKQGPTSTSGIRRTASEGSSGFKRTGSDRNSFTRKVLRRTGSTESNKLNTDTDNLKDMRMKLLDINTIKYTVVMIVIASVFIVSCVPFLVLAIWRAYSDENLVYEFSDAALVWFQIGLRSYFLNCAINPFIYGFFNSQFRDYFYNKFCCCCKEKESSSDQEDSRSPRGQNESKKTSSESDE